jgi:hypothetical protein
MPYHFSGLPGEVGAAMTALVMLAETAIRYTSGVSSFRCTPPSHSRKPCKAGAGLRLHLEDLKPGVDAFFGDKPDSMATTPDAER